MFAWTKAAPQSPKKQARNKRAKERRATIEKLKRDKFEKFKAYEEPVDMDIGADIEIERDMEIGANVEMLDAETVSNVQSREIPQQTSKPTENKGTQSPRFSLLSIEQLKLKPKALTYYTGCHSAQHFDFILDILGKAAYHLKYYTKRRPRHISVENQLLITLIKLRCHMPYIELAHQFNSSEKVISNICITWINFMAVQFEKLNVWPSKDLVRFYQPICFKEEFPSTRTIIDGFEVPMIKSSNPITQSATYSTYKNKNTEKGVVGCTPGGLVNEIPIAYGGASSDRQIIERSKIPEKCDPKDSIMCDKGFNSRDLFLNYEVKVNEPTFLRKKNRFSAKEIEGDQKIASVRVHIERIIGLCRTFRIMKGPFDAIESKMASQIFMVCFMLCNFRNCIC